MTLTDMNMKELREKKDLELDKLLAESRERQHALRFKDSGKQLKEVRDIRKLKKDIARILTLKKERQIADAKN